MLMMRDDRAAVARMAALTGAFPIGPITWIW
jgi:hypothetical protein